MALITAQRVQTLSKITIDNIKIFENEAKIYIPDQLKTSNINRMQPVLNISKFNENENLCVLTILKLYLARTAIIRPENCMNLFITCKKPHHPATSQTISRWIKCTLHDSGIDTVKFTAHSTRHASTSAASRNGASIECIRKAAGWTKNSQVFARFYNQPLQDDLDFSSCVLTNR